MSITGLRPEIRGTVAESHPWIDFQLDLRKVSHVLWMLTGEARSKCEHIAGVPLRPETAASLYEIYLSKGVHATTSIEGNTLTEEQVRRHIKRTLKLPRSQKYLGDEVRNIADACNQIARDLLANPAVTLDRERIGHFNGLVLRGLEVEEHVIPGEVREYQVGVLNYRGAPWEACKPLLDRLCDWLNRDFACEDPDMKFAMSLFKAIVAHLYIAWIHPFGDGNGRTARLIEFQLLIQSGVPFPAAHLLSNHYNKTRTRYYAELDRSSKTSDGWVGFMGYAIQGFVDGLREQLAYIRDQQHQVTWENYVHKLFQGEDTPARRRQKHLVLDMPEGETARRELTTISTRIAAEYATKGEKTLTRDLNSLMKMGLVIRKGRGYAPNQEVILAFLPPRCEEPPPPEDGKLF